MAARRNKRSRKRRVRQERFNIDIDPRDLPRYAVREAADYVGVSRGGLRHWLKPPATGRAVIETPEGGPTLSFYNLMEAHVLRVATERNVPLRRIRTAVDNLRDRKPNEPHPLLSEELFTGGPLRSLFIRSLNGDVNDIGNGGQMAFRQLVTRFLTRIDRDEFGNPYQLRPYGFQHVAIHYRVAGGAPVIKGTGILIEMIASRKRGGESITDLASDYALSPSDVRDAVKYSRVA